MDDLVAKYEGVLKLGDKELPCAVLSDNSRILTASSVFNAFDRPRKGKSSEEYRVDRMPAFINANNLQPFVSQELIGWTEPIQYVDLNGKVREGYNAQILRELCKVYIDARKANALLKSQERFADIAEAILYSLSSVGIVALVDEATGYQYERERDELQKLWKLYISKELQPWQKRFPDTYYQELFRLNGWDYTVTGIQKRPGVIGKWTNTLIYEQLPDGVLEHLKENTPKSEAGNYTARLHQSLTVDVGEPHLSAQITKVITIFRLSSNMEEMWTMFKRLVKREHGQLELPFVFDSNGYTQEKKEPNVSNKALDNALKKALSYNPNEDNESK